MDRHISLSWPEVAIGALTGILRRVQSRISGLNKGNIEEMSSWNSEIEAACAEIAVAKYLNQFWCGAFNTFKGPDVGKNIQVRYTYHSNHCLIIRPGDPKDDRFVLISGESPHFVIHGWIDGNDGVKSEYLKNPGGHGQACFVPQDVLHDINILKMPVI